MEKYRILEYQEPTLIQEIITQYSYFSNDLITIIIKYLHFMAGKSGMSFPYVYIEKGHSYFDI